MDPASTIAPRLAEAFGALPRVALAALPTPLERGPVLPGGARLWVKRDDLTGLGGGGNKTRKLELLCGQALADGADVLVTTGAPQSNHARQTAAAGAVLSLPVELALSGSEPAAPTGNQLLSELFGACVHYAGADGFEACERLLDRVVADLRAAGRRPAVFGIGGSSPVSACAFALAWIELLEQCAAVGLRPRVVIVASSTGSTHGGMAAGRAIARAEGLGWRQPALLATCIAKIHDPLDVVAERRARECLALLGLDDIALAEDDVVVDWDQEGPGYAIPTDAADAAIRWAARHMALILDRVYTGKAFATLLHACQAGRYGDGDDVVFWHTGGLPAVFAPGGAPEPVSSA